jgi:hypothetical protein
MSREQDALTASRYVSVFLEPRFEKRIDVIIGRSEHRLSNEVQTSGVTSFRSFTNEISRVGLLVRGDSFAFENEGADADCAEHMDASITGVARRKRSRRNLDMLVS